MNVFNRAIAVVILVIMVILLAVSIFLAMSMPERAVMSVSRAVESLQSHLNLVNRLIFSGVAALLLVACLLLLWMEVRRPQLKAIQVQDVTAGEARVSIDSIVQRLEYNVGKLQDVVSVKPYVWGKGNGVEVSLSIQTEPEIDVPMKTEEVVQLTKEVIEKHMGLKLHKVTVEIKHAPYSEKEMM